MQDTRHFSTNKGCNTIADEMEICPGVLRRYYQISCNPRRTYIAWLRCTVFLHKAGASSLLEKGESITDKIDVIGHVIWPGSWQFSDYTTRAIQDLKPLCSVAGLKFFIDL